MRDLGTPVLDDHLHLDRDGKGIEAAREFARSGGTHLLVVNKPSWHLGVEAEDGADFRAVFSATLALAADASAELRGRAWPVLGVHPGLVSRLVDDRGFSADEAAKLMKAGLDEAATYAADGEAVALKSGRPHYDVSDDVWAASNEVLRHALELGAETGVAVQLHTEHTDDLTEVAGWAEDAGLPPERVVKHYATGELAGVTGSVMSEKEYLTDAIDAGDPFLMETDFVDDPDNPGMVLGPKTVPRRVAWLREEGFHDAVERAHVTTPERVYGVDTAGTLD
ncbi:TatD family hydrolase [Halocalculus aciditolerans]|uniref:Deoxyribonuclease n=1 Tax=Halocalculus aciditolerans TaxID=1383812 RepID=A0A830FH71_9EURY|nr:TatD family hydrolase [Halocalculus aciditolerans]GGL52337.1 deoxyribonuclease [Halocalculus aciditolerans]